MKPIYKALIGVASVGVTITLVTLTINYIRQNKFGKGVGQKEATVEDKNSLTITFVR